MVRRVFAPPVLLALALGGCGAGAGGGAPGSAYGPGRSAAGAAVAAFASACRELGGAAIAREAEDLGFQPVEDATRRLLLPDGDGAAWTRVSDHGREMLRWRERGRVCEMGAGGFGRADAETALDRLAADFRAGGGLLDEAALGERRRSFTVRPPGAPPGEAHVVILSVDDDPRAPLQAFMSRRPAAPVAAAAGGPSSTGPSAAPPAARRF